MRALRLLLRITGYGAFWAAIVLFSGVAGSLLPILLSIGQDLHSEGYGLGLAVLLCGMGGLIAGTLPATICVMFLAKRNDRRTRENSLRSQ